MSDAFLSSDDYGERAHQLYNEGRYDEAKAYYEEALPIRRSLGDKAGVSSGLFALGRLSMALGELDKAAACMQEALSLDREIGDEEGEEPGDFSIDRVRPAVRVGLGPMTSIRSRFSARAADLLRDQRRLRTNTARR